MVITWFSFFGSVQENMGHVLLHSNFMSFCKERMRRAFSKPSLPSPTQWAWSILLPTLLELRFEYTSGVGVGGHFLYHFSIAVHETCQSEEDPGRLIHPFFFSFLEHLTCCGRLLGKSVMRMLAWENQQRESWLYFECCNDLEWWLVEGRWPAHSCHGSAASTPPPPLTPGGHFLYHFSIAVHETCQSEEDPGRLIHPFFFSFLEHLTCCGRLLGKSVMRMLAWENQQRESYLFFVFFLFYLIYLIYPMYCNVL